MRSAPKGTGGHKVGGYLYINAAIMVRLLLWPSKQHKEGISKYYIYINKKLVKLEPQTFFSSLKI